MALFCYLYESRVSSLPGEVPSTATVREVVTALSSYSGNILILLRFPHVNSGHGPVLPRVPLYLFAIQFVSVFGTFLLFV